MAERGFQDPILELSRRMGVGTVLDMAVSDDEAETVLEVLDEVDAEQKARAMLKQIRQMGHLT